MNKIILKKLLSTLLIGASFLTNANTLSIFVMPGNDKNSSSNRKQDKLDDEEKTYHHYEDENKGDYKPSADNSKIEKHINWDKINYTTFKNKKDAGEIKDNEEYKNVVLDSTDLDEYYIFNRTVKIDANGYCEIPEGVTKIGDYCFVWCSDLKSIKLPSTLKEIGNNAFCFSKLESIEIPEGVTKIGENVFSICRNLKTIIAPKNVINLLKSSNNLPRNVEIIESKR